MGKTTISLSLYSNGKSLSHLLVPDFFAGVGLRRELYNGVQGHVDSGAVARVLVRQVAVQNPKNSLVGHDPAVVVGIMLAGV